MNTKFDDKTRKNKREDYKEEMIKRQFDKIESFKKTIEELEINSSKKDELNYSLELLHKELLNIIRGLKKKDEQYERLIDDLVRMREIMNQKVFKGKWKFIRFLLK